MEADLPASELVNIHENRTHTIDDVLKREYQVLTSVIEVGGAPGDQLYLLDPIELFLSQANVLDKVAGFAFLRTFLNVRFEFTVAPKTSGGLILAFFADMDDDAITNRTTNLVQISQTPNMQISLTTSKSVIMRIPWVSSFLARNLQTGTGRPGKLYVGRLTPLDIGTVKMTVYIQADSDTLHLEYPTPKPVLQNRELLNERMRKIQVELRNMELRESVRAKELADIKKKAEVIKPKQPARRLPSSSSIINSLPVKHVYKSEANNMVTYGSVAGALMEGSKIATAAAGLPVVGSAAASAAPILKTAANIAGACGYSKPTNDQPVTPVKWKQGDGQLTAQNAIPHHVYTLDQENKLATDYAAFGTQFDEMSIDYIMGCPNILTDKIFTISSDQEPRKVLAKFPLVINPVVEGDKLYLTQQAWVSNTCQNWLANLQFDFDVYLTMFHNVKLRFLIALNDYNTYNIGDIVDEDYVNKGMSKVVQFTADNANAQIPIGKMLNTSMKYVATPFALGGESSINNLKYYQETEICSLGTLYVIVEVPLEVTGDVAQKIYCVPKFHCRNVELSNPSTHLIFRPLKHMIAEKHSNVTLTTDFYNNSRSASQTQITPKATGPGHSAETERNLQVCMGDKFEHLNKLLLAVLPFGPTSSLDNTNALIVNPYQFRAVSDSEYIDLIDYFASGYGFYNGHIAMRMLLYEKQGYVGESFVMSKFANQYLSNVPPTGFLKVGDAGYITTGVRCIPHFAQEGVVDASVPYYQGFNIARVSHSNTYGSWTEGQLPTQWYFKSTIEQKVKLYRGIKDGFKFGFLTSLPPFEITPNKIINE